MQDPSTAFQGIRPPPGAPQFPPPEQQEQHLKCPRCDSTNTKFCYYNNYNLSQPRHFCKSCRRYWTKGGALRNIPVGGGTRKNSKRGGSGASSSNGGRGGGNNNNNASNSGGGGGISANASSSGATGQQAKRPNTSVSVPPQFTSTGVTHHTMPQQLSYASPVQTLHHLPTLYAAHPADQEHQLLDMGGSFSSLLTSAGHFSSLIDATAFHPVVTGPGGPMTLPVGAHIGGGGSSGLGLLRSGDGHELSDHPQPPPQNPSGTSNVVPGTSAAPENFPGLHGCWDGDGGPDGGVGGGDGTGATGGGWPGLSIYTPSSGFR